MNVVEKIHSGYVLERRVRVLSEVLARHIPRNARVLDVGAGDGLISYLIQQKRPDLHFRGLDVLVREKTFIPVESFGGSHLPGEDASWDVVMFIDVLHHTADPMILLREALRVSRKGIVIKDHTADGWLADATLRFMDHVGNRRHGVALPYNYWPERKWRKAFESLNLIPQVWQSQLGLYPWPARILFERKLHFVAHLVANRAS